MASCLDHVVDFLYGGLVCKKPCRSFFQVEEPIQHCGGEGADPGSCPLSQRRKHDGPSARHKGIGKDISGVVRSHNQGRKSNRLSVVDDIEVVGYLNTKEEIHRKRILWEAMNENHTKAKKQKRAAETKKGVAVKKVTKTTEKVEPKSHGSRINDDALKFLRGDLQESCESGEATMADSCAQNSPKRGSKESWYEEDQSDNDTFGGDEEDEMHYQYRDDHFYDDFDS
ncbi:uncharacterized protein LOC131015094 isoform X2 [Salvia miltiorrhiza]|uniref:uncharacterized protein LOC131015094 isoform X2 n=1 Tax=Salvia miltiorrhiza TaxID=226208 RepID=UPI0025ACB7A5|nr:uncharacterized protein LOC131015094 isoform X2 [Salvia miltiorrhiza]